MTDGELAVEYMNKIGSGEPLDDPLLIVGAVVLDAYIKQRRRELLEDPGIGAESFKGSVEP